MDRLPSPSLILLGIAVLGCVTWAYLAHTAAALEQERGDLTVQARHLTETENRVASEIAREEKAQAAAAEKEAQLGAIRHAIQTIARLPVPPLAKTLPSRPLPPPPKGPHDNAMFAELLDDPEYAQLCIMALRQEVDERYGATLFRVRADPAKFTSLTRLLIERRIVAIEAEHIAIRQGFSPLQQSDAVDNARDRLEA
jgi:hypothetical protein